MSNYRALISDIDGTLIEAKHNAEPSVAVRNAIRTSLEKGHTICLASGRPFSLIKPIADGLGITGLCISDNGATITEVKSGTILWEATLPLADANAILQKIQHQTLFRASTQHESFVNPSQLPVESKVRKISVHDIDHQTADILTTEITNSFTDVTVVKAGSFASPDLVDIYFSHTNATKQYAVFELSKILNIPTSEMIGIGDGYNDFSLLMACGKKVAMGNAVDELKAIADEIAPSVEEDGLAIVLEKYL